MGWKYSKIEKVKEGEKIFIKYFVGEDKKPWRIDEYTLEEFEKFKQIINEQK